MTTLTDTFNYTLNPLGGTKWGTVTAAGLQGTTTGAKGSSSVTQDNVSMWLSANNAFLADQSSELTFGSTPTNNDWAGVGVRLATTGGGRGYIAYYIPETSVVFIVPLTSGTVGSGTVNNIGAVAATFASGDKLKLTVAGTTLTVYKNGSVLTTTPTPVNSSTYTTGQPGLAYQFGNTNGTKISAWSGVDAASGGPSIAAMTAHLMRRRRLN